jgi:carbon starvation protein
MAQIFSSIPGLEKLMSYWYHFAIMFEALFILTIIDAGTRIARFVLQEALGKFHAPFGKTNWLPGNLFTSSIIVFSWAYFVYTGSVSTIWPMFGTANQLLACLALAVGTSYIINTGKVKYAWVTIIPMIFVGITTLTAGTMNIKNLFLPQVMQASTRIQGSVNLVLTIIIMFCVLAILADAVPRWWNHYRDYGLRNPGSGSQS